MVFRTMNCATAFMTQAGAVAASCTATPALGFALGICVRLSAWVCEEEIVGQGKDDTHVVGYVWASTVL